MGLSSAQMYAKVSRRALTTAQHYASAYADAQRNSLVIVSRGYTFNETDRNWDRGSSTVIYDDKDASDDFTGLGAPAGIASTTGPMTVDFGDEPTSYDSVMIYLPLSMPVEPRIDDLVTVTYSPDRGFSGRTFRIEDVNAGGRLSSSVTCRASGPAPRKED